MTSRIFPVPLFFVAAALMLSPGCGHKDGAATHSASNIFRYPIKTSPTTFDPAMVQDGDTIDLLQQVFEGLVQWSPDNKIVPCLADEMGVSQDGLTYTFHLRPGVKFQDGSPVTAADVEYSLTARARPEACLARRPQLPGRHRRSERRSSGKAKDLRASKSLTRMTVAITITKPKAYWIYTLTYPTATSSPKPKGDRMPGTDRPPISPRAPAPGRSRSPAYARDSKVTMTANAAYWDGAPKLAGIERPVVMDANTRHDMYVHGDIDMLQFVPPGNLVNDSQDPALKNQIQLFPRASTCYIGLNQKAFPAFKDVRVRQALAYATDKSQIVQVVFAGKRDVAEDILAKGIPGFDPDFKGLPYDPAKAKALLAQAGHPNGAGLPPIPIYYRQS